MAARNSLVSGPVNDVPSTGGFDVRGGRARVFEGIVLDGGRFVGWIKQWGMMGGAYLSIRRKGGPAGLRGI